MARPKSPIGRHEALALLALAREVQPPGTGPRFDPSPVQLRAARAAFNMPVQAVAMMTDLPVLAIENAESGINRDRDVVQKFRWAMQARGAIFVRQSDAEGVAFRQ